MENITELEDHIAFGLVEYDEALAHLYSLRDRYGHTTAVGQLGSAARSHEARWGHRLRFGCCAGVSLVELFPDHPEAIDDAGPVRRTSWPGGWTSYYAANDEVNSEHDDGTRPRQPRSEP